METINDIINSVCGLVLDSINESELILSKKKESNVQYFNGEIRATSSDMVAQTVVSLDSLVSFCIENNISLTKTNERPQKYLFLNSRIYDTSISRKIKDSNIKFVTGSHDFVKSGGYLLQENGAYLLQENGFKIKL